MSTEREEQAVLVPRDEDSEACVLASCMLDPQAIAEIPELEARDFWVERHRITFEAIQHLVEEGVEVDMLTVAGRLKDLGRYEEFGGFAYLSDLVGILPTATHVRHYAAKVLEHSRRRALISEVGRIAARAYDRSVPIAETFRATLTAVQALAVRAEQIPIYYEEELSQVAWDLIQAAKSDDPETRPLPTGLHKMDAALSGGTRKEELFIVAGRPSMGKSTFAMTLVREASRRGVRPLVVSLEMSRKDLVERELSARGHAEWRLFEQRVRAGEKLETQDKRFGEVAMGLLERPLSIVDHARLTTEDVRRLCQRVLQEKGELGMLVVDHIGLLRDPPGTRSETEASRLGRITSNLKAIAKDFHIPVVGLCQLSRAVEYRTNKRPIMSDLRESGHIEQDADVIMMLYRENYYDPTSENKDLEVIVAKDRMGRAGGSFSLLWVPEAGLYGNEAAAYLAEPKYGSG